MSKKNNFSNKKQDFAEQPADPRGKTVTLTNCTQQKIEIPLTADSKLTILPSASGILHFKTNIAYDEFILACTPFVRRELITIKVKN